MPAGLGDGEEEGEEEDGPDDAAAANERRWAWLAAGPTARRAREVKGEREEGARSVAARRAGIETGRRGGREEEARAGPGEMERMGTTEE